MVSCGPVKTLAHPDDKAEILRRLQSLRSDSPRQWGRMSAPQVVCHLADAFRVGLGTVNAKPGVTLVTRTLLKWYALCLPWPRGVIPTRAEIDQVRGGGTKPGEFASDMAELSAIVELVTRPDSALEGALHPLFGPLSRAEWLRWGYRHMDHHLRQFRV